MNMKTLLIILFAITATSCAVSSKVDAVHADWINPCTYKQDCEECATWHKSYPSEYYRYAQRMQKRNFDDYCKF